MRNDDPWPSEILAFLGEMRAAADARGLRVHVHAMVGEHEGEPAYAVTAVFPVRAIRRVSTREGQARRAP